MKQTEETNGEQRHEDGLRSDTTQVVIPVIEEQMTVDREIVETGKVRVRTTVREEQHTVSLPVVSEQFEVRHIPVDKVFRELP